MCLSPVYIQVKPLFRPDCSCKRSDVSFVPKDKRALALFTQGIEVGCGKCIECVKSKQFDYAQYFERICKDFSTMFYCTLTYEDSKIPICRHRVWTAPADDEYFVNDMKSTWLIENKVYSSYHPRLPKYLHEEFDNIDKIRLNVTARLSGKDNYPVAIDDTSDLYIMSLCRKDVAKWLKRCRMSWFRERNVKMSDFKVFYIGEYGDSEKGATHRPHYHIVFLGATEKEFWYMVNKWKMTFGFVDTSSYKVAKGHEGYVTNYLSKYMVKTTGELGIEFKYPEYAERPRIVSSLNLLNLTDEEIKHFRCEDLCDEFSCPIDLPARCLERIKNYRSYVDKNGNLKTVPLVGHLKRKFFYEKRILSNHKYKINVYAANRRKKCYTGVSPAPCRESRKHYANANFTTFFKVKVGATSTFKPYFEYLDIKKTSFVPIPLQVAVTHLVVLNSINDYKRAERAYCEDSPDVSPNDFAISFKCGQEMEKSFRARASERVLREFYTHCK